jgi:hypothetical protein
MESENVKCQIGYAWKLLLPTSGMEFFNFFEKGSLFYYFVLKMSLTCSRSEKLETNPNKFENLSILAYFGQF